MPRTWAHPLSRAVRTLTLRIQQLEREKDADPAAWDKWHEYIDACDAVARLIAVTTAPGERIARGELAQRFRKGAGG